ncbi:AAA domain-containing protein [Paraperlucidibaca baekdonensis]|uniref:AAA domain-containing protein n=1 Tax=Paraperlucidibaca baekdonensis TaxID=748120 RepID=A0A3E0H9D1_9GAMM|nr:ParA family protein [Paraperlucidibaca baekdonensis]REH40321.1 AAA domain-containing protein [Paraperlucidibaca baekdonensis]
MIALAMFNNKGGVGKTTLTCNIASYLAKKKGKRVLVIDCDPQCNATQLIMGEEYAAELYFSKTASGATTTISDILRPIEDGDSDIENSVIPIKSSDNRFGVDLIPGHPSFSIIEDRLGAAWHELLGGDIGGIRKTNWNTYLKRKLSNNYDYVLYDLGPSLGSINRSVLIGCDNFMTPMGTDIFSILGIRNISTWLQSWVDRYENGLRLCERNSAGRLKAFKLDDTLPITSGYIGYTIQQYITKSKSGVRRPTRAYEQIISNVPDEIKQSLSSYLSTGMTIDNVQLGDVPHLYSLIPLAQSVSSPLFELKSGDGIVGTQGKQKDQYEEILGTICSNLISNINLGQ